MPKIIINSCGQTPNSDALEAIGKWMLENYLHRDYQESRVITVKSKRKIKVTELPKSNKGICDCNFEVIKID